MDHHLAMLTDPDAFRADAGHIFQRQMDDAAFARGHGVEAKRLLGGLHALGGDFGGHAQLFKAQRAISAAIDVNFFVELRLKAQNARCSRALSTSALRSSRISLSRPSTSASTSTSLPPPGSTTCTLTFNCNPAARRIFSRKSRSASAAALRSSCPF